MIPCETSLLFQRASQLVLCVAGVVRSTSREIHVNKSDGSCTRPRRRPSFDTMRKSEASLERGKDGGNAFRLKVVGQEARNLARHIRSRVRVGNPDPTGPRLGESCDCDQKNGTDIFENRRRDGKPEIYGVGKPWSVFPAPRGGAGRGDQSMLSRWKECRR